MKRAIVGGAWWWLATWTSSVVAVSGCAGDSSQGSAPVRGVGGAAGSGGASIDGTGGTIGGTGRSNGASGGSGGSAGDRDERAPGSIPMFIAQGHAGRTVISCDDGRSWVADQSDEEWGFCANPANDCDHGPGAGRGIAWGDGWFFATFGWGAPGSVRRSRDGVTWEPVLEGTTFGGMVFGNGRLIAASRNGQYSDDLGRNWTGFDAAGLTSWNVRDAAFVPHDGGRFVMVASDGSPELVVSVDGMSWARPESAPSDCGEGLPYQGRIAYGNGTIVLIGDGGVICRSTDGGQTWSSKKIADSLRANGIWNGSEFMAWNYGTLHRSTDGEAWTTTETVPDDIDIGVTAVSDSGTIVGVTSHWQQHYDAQVFYRSEDGVHWEVLPSDAYPGGHPIKVMAFGYGQPSERCE